MGQDQKLQEFRIAGDAFSITANEQAKSGLLASGLVDIFSTAHGEDANREHANLARQVREGVVTPDQLNIRVGGTEAIILQRMLRQSKAKKNIETQMFLATLNDLQDQIDRLTQEIEAMEAGLEAKYGDSWREELALKILGEDDIPQRMPGESVEEYRERLETLLIEEMLNPDGSIKDKYLNDPEMKDYIEWARKNGEMDKTVEKANDLKEIMHDESIPTHQKIEHLEKETSETAQAAKQGATQEVKAAIDNKMDSDLDEELSSQSNESFDNAFGAFANNFSN